MPDTFPDYPNWRQVRDYIREFDRTYDLHRHVTLSTAVTKAEPLDGGRWRVATSAGAVNDYDGLIVATGVTWHPSVPAIEGAEAFKGKIRHSNTFRAATEFDGRRVLIIGCGNSGVDIACDAAQRAERAFLSVRRGYRFLPKHIFGLPSDAVLEGYLPSPEIPDGVTLPHDLNGILDLIVGDLTHLGLPAPDHDALQSHPIMNTQVLHHLAHGDLAADAKWREMKRADQPDLRGGMTYLESPRHANYVDSVTYQGAIRKILEQFGRPLVDDGTYDALRTVAQ